MAGDREVALKARQERRSQERGRRREQLVDAAVEEIRKIGPGATMEQLARAGGVTKPILYRHFGDRDGLIGAIAERFSADLLMSVSGPLQATSEPRSLLGDTVASYVRFLERDPYLYGFLIQQPTSARGADPNPIGSLADVIARQIALVAGEQLQAAGRDSGAALPWAYGIVGLVHQATHWWLQDRSMSRDRFIRYLTDLLWDGIAGAALVPAADDNADGAAAGRGA